MSLRLEINFAWTPNNKLKTRKLPNSKAQPQQKNQIEKKLENE